MWLKCIVEYISPTPCWSNHTFDIVFLFKIIHAPKLYCIELRYLTTPRHILLRHYITRWLFKCFVKLYHSIFITMVVYRHRIGLVNRRLWVRIRPGRLLTFTELNVWIFFHSNLHIFFAYLSYIILIHHAIYHSQVMFCWFEKLFQGID